MEVQARGPGGKIQDVGLFEGIQLGQTRASQPSDANAESAARERELRSPIRHYGRRQLNTMHACDRLADTLQTQRVGITHPSGN